MNEKGRNAALNGYLLGLAGVIAFGGTLPATRILVMNVDPVLITLARASIAGLAAMALLALLAGRGGGIALFTLAGLMIASLAGALTSLVISLAPNPWALSEIVTWLMGALTDRSWADVALAASGTVSLELAAAGTPMVVAYDMGWLSREIIGRMLLVDTVTLVNLVSETRAVPEFIGKACRPAPIADALLSVLEAPQAQVEAMALTMERLGRGGPHPGDRAAQAVLEGLGRG